MDTKTVYLFDENTGEFTGVYEACPDPMEPGKFIEPTYSVSTAPPVLATGEKARWLDGVWTVIPASQPIPEPPTHQELVARVMLGMKSKRLEIFRGLDTLQVDALTAGNTARAEAIMQAKAAMIALNNIDLSGYQTAEAMEGAIQQAYWGIVAQAPQEVQDAFNALVPR